MHIKKYPLEAAPACDNNAVHVTYPSKKLVSIFHPFLTFWLCTCVGLIHCTLRKLSTPHASTKSKYKVAFTHLSAPCTTAQLRIYAVIGKYKMKAGSLWY